MNPKKIFTIAAISLAAFTASASALDLIKFNKRGLTNGENIIHTFNLDVKRDMHVQTIAEIGTLKNGVCNYEITSPGGDDVTAGTYAITLDGDEVQNIFGFQYDCLKLQVTSDKGETVTDDFTLLKDNPENPTKFIGSNPQVTNGILH